MVTGVDCISIGIDSLFESHGNTVRFPNLDFASSDALYFSQAVENYFVTENVITMSDDHRVDISPIRSDILKYFNNLGQEDSGNPLIVYFAGHGFQYNNDFYICPKDYYDEASHHTGISLDIALEMLSMRKNWILLIFDTCRVVMAKRNLPHQKMPQLNFNINEKTAIITSCSAGQYALEIDQRDSFIGGIFSRFFIDSIAHLSNEDINVYKLFSYARNQVQHYFSDTPQYNQTPSIVGGDTSSFILTYKRDATL